jgi:putative PIN family toxin of toxin-antitoxin system
MARHFAEYTGVLRRPRFALEQQTIDRWSELLALWTVNVESPPKVAEFPRDPKDAPFLAAALMTHADYLITGDKDLLDAKKIVHTHRHGRRV